MNLPGMTHIAYKGGGPAIQGFLSKEVPVLFSPAPVAIPHIAGGKFRVIAQTGSTRLSSLPNIPTMVESGEKDFSAALVGGAGPGGYSRGYRATLERCGQQDSC